VLTQKRELENSFMQPAVKKIKGNKKVFDLENFKKKYSFTQGDLDGDKSKLLERFCQEKDLSKFTIHSQEKEYTPFVYRKQGEDSVIQLLKQNENHFLFNSKQMQPDKGKYSFLIATGGAGTGKSRACHETKNIVRRSIQNGNLPSRYNYSIHLLLDYSNVHSLCQEEYEYGPEISLGLRIFLTLCSNIDVEDFVGTDMWLFLCEYKLLSLNVVFEVVGRRLHSYFNTKEDVPIFLLLDEFQMHRTVFGDGLNENLSRPSWRNGLHLIGRYCVNTAEKNKNYNRDHLLIHTMISGTLSDSDMRFDLDYFGNLYFPLPYFSYPTIRNVLQHCVSGGKIPKWSLETFMERFWWIMGLVPRTLMTAIMNLEEKHYLLIKLEMEMTDLDILKDLNDSVTIELDNLYTNRYSMEDNVTLCRLASTNLPYSQFGSKSYYFGSK
jgi:hypothetical protein